MRRQCLEHSPRQRKGKNICRKEPIGSAGGKGNSRKGAKNGMKEERERGGTEGTREKEEEGNTEAGTERGVVGPERDQ